MDWTSLWRLRRRTGLVAVVAALAAMASRFALAQPALAKPKAPTLDTKAAAIQGTSFLARLTQAPVGGQSVEFLVRSLDPNEAKELSKTVATQDVEFSGLQFNQNYAIKARLIVAGEKSDWTPEIVRSSALPAVARLAGVELPAFSSARLDWTALLPSNVAARSEIAVEMFRRRGASISSVSSGRELVGSLLDSGHLNGDTYSVRLVSKKLSADTGAPISSELSPFVALSLVGMNTGSPVQMLVHRVTGFGSF